MISKLKSYLIDKYFIKKPKLRRWVTRLIYGDHDMQANLFGCTLTIHSVRENGYLRAYQKAASSSLFRDEVSVLLALSHVLREGDCFVDIGANIGLYSAVMSRLPGVKVLAIEANPDTCRRLGVNASRHRFESRNIAISDVTGELEFSEGAVSHVFAVSAHRTIYNTSETVKVSSITLSEMLADRAGPFVLKIDVEDHEPQVLAGASSLLESGRIAAVLLDVSMQSWVAAKTLRASGFHIVDASTFGEPSELSGAILAIHPSRCPKSLVSTHS
jgi:FkbM family methyltransferase